MARYTESGRDAIDETMKRWAFSCLLGEESLLFEGRGDVWTIANVADLRRRFNDERLEGDEGGGKFDGKWELQMADASEDVRLLAAELLLVHFLFASSVGAAKKLECVGAHQLNLCARESALLSILTRSRPPIVTD